jgi:hypothetical protein
MSGILVQTVGQCKMQIWRYPENFNQTTDVFRFHIKIGLRLRAAFVKVIDHESWHKLYQYKVCVKFYFQYLKIYVGNLRQISIFEILSCVLSCFLGFSANSLLHFHFVFQKTDLFRTLCQFQYFFCNYKFCK